MHNFQAAEKAWLLILVGGAPAPGAPPAYATEVNGYVLAYKMIFAVLERRLIQLLIKWLQFLSIIFLY